MIKFLAVPQSMDVVSDTNYRHFFLSYRTNQKSIAAPCPFSDLRGVCEVNQHEFIRDAEN